MNRGDKIYANTPGGGSPLGFNSLFERLENLRQLHYTSATQLNASALTTPINTATTKQGEKVQTTSISSLNDALNTLKKSSWEVSNTDGTTTTLEENFSSYAQEVSNVGWETQAEILDEFNYDGVVRLVMEYYDGILY